MASPIGEHRAGAFGARSLDYEVDGARLLSNVALEGHPGELIGLIGPNGAGKSTLLRVLAGIVRRSGGEVLIEGLDLNAIPPREMARRLALVSQHAPETYGFTALEIVLTGRYPHLGRLEIEGAEDEAIALDSMRLTDAEPFSARVASSLSGGERQRVFLARALAQQPRILLLDEPTASLDVRHQMAIFDLVRQLTRTRHLTAVAAVHDLRLAARYCDRLVLMHHSRIVADGPAEAVLTREHLADVFGVRALVYREPFGGLLSVDFHPGPPDGGARHAGRVHVAAGATGVAGLLHQLVGVGFEVSAEGLADGSLDRFVADALGVAIVSGASVPDAFVVCAGKAGLHDSDGAHFRCRDMSGDGRCLAETEEEVVAEACRRIGAEGCTEHARVDP